MRISPINNNSNEQQKVGFKSTYPVVYKIVHNGVYIPVSDFKTVKKMQGKIVRILNSSLEKILSLLDKEAIQNVMNWTKTDDLGNVKSVLKLPKTEKEALAIFRGRIGFLDTDYFYISKVRSLYNKQKGWLDGRYYRTYIASGNNAKELDDIAKKIGPLKHEAKSVNLEEAPELKDEIDTAIKNYNVNGLEYVNDSSRRLTSKLNGMTYILCVIYEAVKNNAGKIKDYKFVSAKFEPEFKKI